MEKKWHVQVCQCRPMADNQKLIELPDDIADDYYDYFENIGGLKVDGWPTLIQSQTDALRGKCSQKSRPT